MPALEMTTREVVHGLRRASLSRAITESSQSFLDRCDLVKFAKLRPGADRSRELMGMARSLVAMTSGGQTGADGQAAGPATGAQSPGAEESGTAEWEVPADPAVPVEARVE